MTYYFQLSSGVFFKAAVKFHILKNSYNKNIWKCFATLCVTRGITHNTNFTKKKDTMYLNLSKVNAKTHNCYHV